MQLDENLPDVYMDPKRIEQVLTNLINNAIKFTDKYGKIFVKGRLESDKSDYIKISVTDTGCGIAADDLKKIFERLYQVKPEHNPNATSTSAGGLGLGLNICKELVNLHEGNLTVESKVGTGSTFSFTLPIYHEDTGLDSLIMEICA